jgi:arsenate reductase
MSDTATAMFHNPACGTSRNTLALIRNSGVEPTVIEHLKTPPSRARLLELIGTLGMQVRDVLRQKGTPYDELKLDDPKWTGDQLIDFMVAHPVLMSRPIVVTRLGTRFCRPSEAVLDILPSPQLAPFAKEVGEPVIDADRKRTGRRVAA